jgi:hypothetical protein
MSLPVLTDHALGVVRNLHRRFNACKQFKGYLGLRMHSVVYLIQWLSQTDGELEQTLPPTAQLSATRGSDRLAANLSTSIRLLVARGTILALNWMPATGAPPFLLGRRCCIRSHGVIQPAQFSF